MRRQNEQTSGKDVELNPLAVEILRRGVKGIEPLIPPWAEGLLMPVTDISLVFEEYFRLWDQEAAAHMSSAQKRKKERALVAELRTKVRALLSPLDGGLVELRG